MDYIKIAIIILLIIFFIGFVWNAVLYSDGKKDLNMGLMITFLLLSIGSGGYLGWSYFKSD